MLRVLSYNVEHSAQDHERTLDAIAGADADVVLLQETTRPWERHLRVRFAAEYPHVRFHHTARLAGGFAVLSRVPLVEDELLPPAEGWFPAHRLVVDAPFGPVQVLHVHLRPAWDGGWVRGFFTTPAIRRREIEIYWAALVPDVPTIVAGDFNEEPGGQALAFLADRGLRRADAGATPTWEWAGHYQGHDVHLRLRLDHVLVDPRIAVRDAAVLVAGASDHRPVLVTIAASAEAVLPAADRGEDVGGGAGLGAASARGALDGGLAGADERVGRELVGHGGRRGRLVAGARRGDGGGALGDRGAVGLDHGGEAQVRRGVLVPEVDAGVRRQRGQPRQRRPHHLRGALEQPAAAGREQRVAGEHRAGVAVDHVGDRPQRVAGVVDDPRAHVADRDLVAVLDEPRRPRHPRGVAPVGDDLERPDRHADALDPTDVIRMVVSGPDRRGLHAGARDRVEDRPRLAGIDDRRQVRSLAHHEVCVVVRETRDGDDPEAHL